MIENNVHAAIMSRHSKDLVVGECKDGPTHGANHRRLDYWVLRRSWAHPAMIGYEVKSSRRDFLSDTKWMDYLPLCNELWFVAPKGAISPEELPAEVGLLRIAGSRLITVRRAVWREVVPPYSLLLYILICRAKIGAEGRDQETPLDYWRRWLAEREEGQEIGYRVSRRLRDRFQAVRTENDRLREENRSLSDLKHALAEKGIEWNLWLDAKEVERRIHETPWDRQCVETAYQALGDLLNKAGRDEMAGVMP